MFEPAIRARDRNSNGYDLCLGLFVEGEHGIEAHGLSPPTRAHECVWMRGSLPKRPEGHSVVLLDGVDLDLTVDDSELHEGAVALDLFELFHHVSMEVADRHWLRRNLHEVR